MNELRIIWLTQVAVSNIYTKLVCFEGQNPQKRSFWGSRRLLITFEINSLQMKISMAYVTLETEISTIYMTLETQQMKLLLVDNVGFTVSLSHNFWILIFFFILKMLFLNWFCHISWVTVINLLGKILIPLVSMSELKLMTTKQ